MKKSVLPALAIAALLLSACGTTQKARPSTPSQRYEYRTGKRPAERSNTGRTRRDGDVTSLRGRELVAYARKFLGTPYKYGANGPDRFDCSGFTVYVYGHFGIRLARNSGDQFAAGTPVRNISRIQPGDLVFFARDGKIFHVGMAVESFGNYFTFIHASNAGVIISRSDETYWGPKYFGAKRML